MLRGAPRGRPRARRAGEGGRVFGEGGRGDGGARVGGPDRRGVHPPRHLHGQAAREHELIAVAEVLKKTARHAATLGVSVGVQPVNRFENYLVNTARGADELIDRVGEPNVFAHLDTFHMNIEEKGFRDPVLRLGDRLRYVHLSESDRGTPGSGNIRWDELFAALSETGFDGRLVLESFVHPDPEMTRLAALWRDVAEDPEEPLREGLPFLRAKAKEHGLRL
ncbi:MAG: hypothetical protein CYG60_10870 [Actinobacteria bacterium]|nr:MAG: hypothetical protein CYG60_10870 [Actinomycetota bacterium]